MFTNNSISFALLISLGIISGCTTSLPMIETKPKGAIAGCVLDGTSGPDNIALVNANVIIIDSNFGARTGKGGRFIITELPPGRYDVRASKWSVHDTKVFGVRVAPDSVTLIDLKTYGLAIPEDPLPYEWEQSQKRILPLREFFSMGGIFDFECKW